MATTNSDSNLPFPAIELKDGRIILTSNRRLRHSRPPDPSSKISGQSNEHRLGFRSIHMPGRGLEADGLYRIPAGSVYIEEKSILYKEDERVEVSNGGILIPDESFIMNDGRILIRNKSITIPEGSVLKCDGCVTLPSGRIRRPDGVLCAPDETPIPYQEGVRTHVINVGQGDCYLVEIYRKFHQGTSMIAWYQSFFNSLCLTKKGSTSSISSLLF